MTEREKRARAERAGKRKNVLREDERITVVFVVTVMVHLSIFLQKLSIFLQWYPMSRYVNHRILCSVIRKTYLS